MGNAESNQKAADDWNPDKNGFNDTFSPYRNGVAESFDASKNGFNNTMTKIGDGFNNAFQKDGIGNQILRKAGEIGNQVGDVYDTAGNALLIGGTAADFMGVPELGIPLQGAGGILKIASPIVKTGSTKLGGLADVIEQPKKDLAKNLSNLVFH